MENNFFMSKIKTGLSLLAWACLSTQALAGELVDRTLDTAEDIFIDIEHLDGAMQVKTWGKAQVRVVGELHDKAEKLIFEQRGSKVKLRVKMPKSSYRSYNKQDGDQLEVFVPVAAKIKYESVNAEFEGAGFKGGADIETVNGDIKVSDLTGRLDIETVNGDIKGHNLAGNIKLETVNGSIQDLDSNADKVKYDSVNGDIEANTKARELRVETVNGDMELELETVDELNLSTVNGSIEAQLNLLPKGDVRASSVGGSIKLAFQPDVSARFEIEAHAGGRIRNQISDDEVRKAKYGPGRWLEFSNQGGDAKVKVSTVHGRITLANR